MSSQDVFAGDELDNASTSRNHKSSKKKKRRQRKGEEPARSEELVEESFPDDGVMKQLQLLNENEIVRAEKKPDIYTISSNNHGFGRNAYSTSKVYLEVKGGFRAVEQMKLAETQLSFSSKKEVGYPEKSNYLAAVGVQGWFRRVAVVGHGILAGLALCQALTVWLLAPPHHTWQDFVEHYTHIAYPFYASSHFLLIVCVISVFDRYDICKFQWQAVRDQLGCPLELLTLFLYPLALAVALMGADRDIRLGQFHKMNNTIWWEHKYETEKQLEEWKILVLIKCVAAIVGWLLLGINPLWDQFHQRLKGNKEA